MSTGVFCTLIKSKIVLDLTAAHLCKFVPFHLPAPVTESSARPFDSSGVEVSDSVTDQSAARHARFTTGNGDPTVATAALTTIPEPRFRVAHEGENQDCDAQRSDNTRPHLCIDVLVFLWREGTVKCFTIQYTLRLCGKAG